ncbi:hypothetical protein BGY98DRAFT_993354, partial [Russula aff. rugulosa BPL654]
MHGMFCFIMEIMHHASPNPPAKAKHQRAHGTSATDSAPPYYTPYPLPDGRC